MPTESLRFRKGRLVRTKTGKAYDGKILVMGEYGREYGGSRWSVMGTKAGQIRDFRRKNAAVAFAKDIHNFGWKAANQKRRS